MYYILCVVNNFMANYGPRDPAHRRVGIGVEQRFIGMAANPKYEYDVNVLFGEMIAENETLKAANDLLKAENAELKKAKK